ncbi:MAG TPA: MFS transporter [Verrucomicrobiae bacterium]|nr:MFS transporter [Verrucomicrobiae bacterium]
MTAADRIKSWTEGFTRTFWIANTVELFERVAMYCTLSVLAVFLAENVGLGPARGPSLVGLFSGLLYTLPIVAGSVVDRYGFRRTLIACFALFAPGYFLIGLAGLHAGQGIVGAIGRTPYVVSVLILTAIGGSLIKPCIVGTVANTTSEGTRALGYSIYYTLVNVGGSLGPLLAMQVRGRLGIQYAIVASSVISAGNLVGALLFFREPVSRSADPARSLGKVLRDMLTVFANIRFLLFLVLVSGFYLLFWQLYYSMPFYARQVLHFEHFELLQSVEGAAIILLTIPVNIVVKKWKPITGISLGMTIAAAAWLLIPVFPAVPVVTAAIVIFSIGEATLSPRLYEYVSALAPQEQLGTYMGFAFLPISIGSFTAGPLAGWLVTNYVMGPNPAAMWFILSALGLACAAGMLLYNRMLSPIHSS